MGSVQDRVMADARADHTAPRRTIPRWSDIKPLLAFQPPRLSGSARLARATTVDDLRLLAARRTPRAVFDYVDGGAEAEVSMARSRRSFAEIRFHPHVLRDVGTVSTATTILGRPAGLPVVLAPTGFTKLVHHHGEVGVAGAARRVGIPYTLSTMGTTSIEELSRVVPGADLWFQLYMWRDRELSRDLIDRALASDFAALVLTVDVPVAGSRLRDTRSGFTMPPTLSVRTVADMARHPSWWLNMLTGGPLGFASMDSSPASVAQTIQRMFDPTVTFADLGWIREMWPRPLVVKGIQRVDDAVRAVEAGADAVVLSNHGGRQLDRSAAPLELLPAVRDAVQDRVEVLVDGGVRSGADVAAAVGLGANAVMIGRSYLYGLMAGGGSGVDRTLEILRTELARTMQLLGARRIQDLSTDLVELGGA